LSTTASSDGMSVDLSRSAGELRARLGAEPFEVALVLGSGLGSLVEAVEEPTVVSFADLDGLPPVGVSGHSGRWVGGRIEGRRVLVQAGRYHLYEGLSVELVCAPVRLAAALGVRTLVVTNAAGGVRRSLGPGTMMLIEDHLDLMTRSPLDHTEGVRISGGSDLYDRDLRGLAESCARQLDLTLERGVYAGLSGPSYETPAEIRMLDRLGADVVGMSTVLEVIAARALGLRCLGISLVTNHGAGIADVPLSHDEVLEMGNRSASNLEGLLRAIIRELPPGPDPL
jgi:purine-nucleoside phosphorylase